MSDSTEQIRTPGPAGGRTRWLYAALAAAALGRDAARVAAQEPDSLLPAARADIAAAQAAAQEPLREAETARANLRAAQQESSSAQADLGRYQAGYTMEERNYNRYAQLVARDVV